MGFRKYAKATIQRPNVQFAEWDALRRDAISPNTDFQQRTAKVILQEYDPSKYMLSHATIVASVDVEDAPTKMGRQYVDGFEVDRRYSDYYITPDTSQFVNNNCFVPGTLVTMSDGTVKPIEDVNVGDEVLTHLGRPRRVLRTMMREVSEDLFEVKPRGTTDRLLATSEHPFFVFRAVESCVVCSQPIQRSVHAISFLIGKHYCSKECYYRNRVPNRVLLEKKAGEFVEAKDLRRTDFTAAPVLKGSAEVDLTLGQARLLGLFLAEGYYTLYAYRDNEKTSPVWAFHKKEASTLASSVQTLLRAEFGVDAKVHFHNNDEGIHVTTPVNRELAGFFQHWICGEGSTTKTLHPSLLTAPLEIQEELLKGWFEGDGSFIETPNDFRLTGCTASRSLASQIQLMLQRVGVSSHLTHAEGKGRKRLILEDGTTQIVPDPLKKCVSWQVTCGGGWIESLVEGTDYEAVYRSTLEARGGVQAAPELRFLNGYHLQMVEKINRVPYSGPVYNLEVVEDNSYLVYGVAVHNCDAFERKLLLASFKTFVGAQSYVEHIQIPELSKGRIIDAAARDIGGSVYVDILIANELKHAPLIRAIKSGKLGTLSMGCSATNTICSKCGNVAEDETHLCACVRYFKGSDFFDSMGTKRKVAELCGHYSDPSSVRFIEASWVANPAFKGAVLRNILTAEEVQQVSDKMHMAMSLPTPSVDETAMLKAARFALGQEEDFLPDDDMEQQDTSEDTSEDTEEDPLQKAVNDLHGVIRNEVTRQIRDEINKSEVDRVKSLDPAKSNDNLVRSALAHPEWRKLAKVVFSFVGKPHAKRILHGLVLHKSGGWKALQKEGFSGREILAVSRVLDRMTQKTAMAGENRVYRTVLSVGGTAPYEDVETYLVACRQVLGRMVTGNEAAKLIEKGNLYALGRS